MLILTAVSELTGKISDIVLFILSLSLFVLWLVTAILTWRRGEPADEMSRKSMGNAFCLCFFALILAGMAAALYCIAFKRAIVLTVPVIFLILAGAFLLYTVFFFVFDKWGKA